VVQQEATGKYAGLLERFHIALVAAIESARPQYLKEPFSIAEIYQDLVPYRTHRDLIGVALNGDYEDALMRLLSGEGGYLLLESTHAQEAIQSELLGNNPNTGLFREYAAAGVRLNPDLLEPKRQARKPDVSFFDRLGTESPSTTPGEQITASAKEIDREVPDRSAIVAVKKPVESIPDAAPARVASQGWDARKDPPPGPTKPSPWGNALKTAGERNPSALVHLPPVPAKSGAGLGDEMTRLREENQRLKILLAERMLELAELRERLEGERGRTS